ncbi:hypothetical protein PHMEG_00024609 [Phytophthora megakarya]|uniref:Uncharacterized protein n=1 Tax=Phytophthora megakarya TaxID=4795 RepID=A0A225VET0_9STRA|nr:hypothetical protein PHMEG_00024609 [Phytophthora megakarya]
MNCSLTIHRLVIEHCLPISGGFASYVVHRIDEYLPVPAVLSQQLFTNACGLGMSEETLECLLHRTTPDWKYAVKAAVQGGHLHVLRWMTERKDRFGPWRQAFENVLDIAATHGHLDVVKWLCEKGVDYHELLEDGIDESTAEYIEKSWLYQHDLGSALTCAAEFGHLDVVQWIYNFCNGSTYSNSIYPVRTPINLAVERGHLDIAQWLYKTSGGSCSTESMDKAASLGDLEILQWLESNHLLKFTVAAMDGAARNGHLGVIKWLHETRTEGCSSRALHLAASNGHFDVVEWLYDNKHMNFDISENTWINAALGGHLRVLRWLHDHFPETISTRTMEAAAKGGHLEVLMWLHELRNKEWINEKSFFQEIYPHCGQPRPRLEVVQWLHTHYPNKFITGLEAAEMGYIDIVRWLSDNSVEGFTTAMDRAAKHGHLDVVLYLMSHRSEGFSNQTMKKPADIEVHCLFEAF